VPYDVNINRKGPRFVTDEPRATVFVCVDCQARGEADAPRSCVTCRVGMCSHIGDGVAALAKEMRPPADPCIMHKVIEGLGITLEL
jgi:hypothetical protein